MLPHVLTRKCGIRPWITCQRGIYGWPCDVDGSKNWHQWSDCVPLDFLSESRMLMLQPSQRVFRFDWTFKIRSHVCMLPGNGWCMLVLFYRCSWVIALDGQVYSHGDVARVCQGVQSLAALLWCWNVPWMDAFPELHGAWCWVPPKWPNMSSPKIRTTSQHIEVR
jgi:hypothetical protein